MIDDDDCCSLALGGRFRCRIRPSPGKLREAGAVILGKTNLSEWANFRSSHSSSGWSGRGGQTKNPYVLDRNPCGSSSGTGAGVSANLAGDWVGTETDGSVVALPVRMRCGHQTNAGIDQSRRIFPSRTIRIQRGPCVAQLRMRRSSWAHCRIDPRDDATKPASANHLLTIRSFSTLTA